MYVIKKMYIILKLLENAVVMHIAVQFFWGEQMFPG